MSNTINILNTLIINNNLYNNQFQTLVSNLQIELKKIITQTQLELINNISKDYNISSKELIKKYVNQKKQGNVVIDSPTFDIISKYYNLKQDEEKVSNKSSNSNVSDDQSSYSSTIINSDGILFGIDDDSKVKSKPKGRPGRKKSTTAESEREKEREREREKERERERERDREREVIENNNFTIFKPVNIKGKNYLLNIKTNEIFDEKNVCIGIKKENKYFIKKT
jgi:hypothetical protein